MNIQQIIAFLVVVTAAAYLGRSLVNSARAFFSKQGGGCAGGCGKCSFAPREMKPGRTTPTSPQPHIIPLGDIQTLPRKKS